MCTKFGHHTLRGTHGSAVFTNLKGVSNVLTQKSYIWIQITILRKYKYVSIEFQNSNKKNWVLDFFLSNVTTVFVNIFLAYSKLNPFPALIKTK